MKYKTAICLIIILFSFSCAEKKSGPMYVEYRVNGFSATPYKFMISYMDTAGLVTFMTTEKVWSKKVCLPEGLDASLAAKPIIDLDLILTDNSYGYLSESMEGATVSLRIIHEKKTVNAGSESLAIVTLSASEIE